MGSMTAQGVREIAKDYCEVLSDPRANISLLQGNKSAQKYNEEKADIIFSYLSAGYTIIEACKAADINDSTVRQWRTPGHASYKPEFTKAFEEAYKWGAHSLEHMAFKLSMDVSGDKYEDINKDGLRVLKPDSARVNARRLAVDTLYRMMGKRDKSFRNKESESSDDQRPINFTIMQFGTGNAKDIEVVKEAQITESENKA